MRVAKMPHVHWDRDSQRFIVRRRVPAELQPILGKNPRVHKFKKGVDQKTANDLSLVILGQWQAEFDAVRMQITEQSTPRAAGPRRDSLITVTTIRQPGEALVVGGRNVRLVRSRPDDRDMLVEYIVPDRPAPVPPKPEPAKVAGCTTETAIGLWRVKRSEGRRFPVGRCLVPASFFYEFTGTKSPKSKWRFTKIGEPWFCFAGLWRPMPEGGAAFTLLTTDPGDDVAPIHDRQMVIVERSDWPAWLQETGNEADLLRALPAGSLAVEQVR